MDLYYDNSILARNLKRQLDKKKITAAELSRYLNVSKSTVSYWLKGEKVPRMDKVDKMCILFNCTRSDLIDESTIMDTVDDTLDLKFALFGGADGITDEMIEEVKRYAEYIRNRDGIK